LLFLISISRESNFSLTSSNHIHKTSILLFKTENVSTSNLIDDQEQTIAPTIIIEIPFF